MPRGAKSRSRTSWWTPLPFLFNGMLGQNVLGFRDSGILLVTNAGADTDFQESRYFEMVSRYFGGAFPDRLEPDPDARRELEETASALSAYRLEPQTIAGQDQALTAPFLQRSFAAASRMPLSRKPSTFCPSIPLKRKVFSLRPTQMW